MSKPRILVLTAAGRTGMPVALQLLDEGFPVTAIAHRADQRSERRKRERRGYRRRLAHGHHRYENSDDRCQACLLLCAN